MPHGTEQAVAGLGDGSVIGTGGNAADADNRLASLAQVLDIEASEVDVDTTSVIGTATNVQSVLEDITTEVVTTHPGAADPHTGYRLESADHSHASTGLQAGNIATSTITGLDTTLAAELSYRPLYATLTSDSASMTEDVTVNTLLTVTPLATGTYDVECFAPYTTDASADFKVQFAGTAVVTATVGTSDLYYMQGPLIGGDATTPTVKPVLLPTSWTTAFDITTTGAPSLFPILFKGRIVVTTVGTITMAACQVASVAFATLVGKGAYLKLQRVA